MGGSETGLSAPARLLVMLAAAVLILAAALLLLLTPLYLHAALDASGSARLLGMSRSEAHALSDRTVGELLVGPGTFAFASPAGGRFYTESEAGHMRDVRTVLYGFLALATLAALAVGVVVARARTRSDALRAVSSGGLLAAGVVTVAGVFAVVAFDRAFELFHQVLFPGGNWAFDPARERLVQLYPLSFWQLTTAVMGVLVIGGGLAVWAAARAVARRSRVDRLRSAAGQPRSLPEHGTEPA